MWAAINPLQATCASPIPKQTPIAAQLILFSSNFPIQPFLHPLHNNKQFSRCLWISSSLFLIVYAPATDSTLFPALLIAFVVAAALDLPPLRRIIHPLEHSHIESLCLFRRSRKLAHVIRLEFETDSHNSPLLSLLLSSRASSSHAFFNSPKLGPVDRNPPWTMIFSSHDQASCREVMALCDRDTTKPSALAWP